MRGFNKMEKKVIEKKAYELLSEGSLSLDEPVDVVQLAKNLGFVVGNVTTSESSSLDGFILIDEENKNVLNTSSSKVIGVNANQDFNKKRFTIAHELGHFKLHYSPEQKIFACRDSKHGRSSEENEIDYFAACLLMPAEGFTKHYHHLKKDDKYNIVERLAEIFKVPEESAMRRLEELQLLELK